MTYGELIGIVLVLALMMVGFNYMDKSRSECKLKAVGENHMSIDDARKLCNP